MNQNLRAIAKDNMVRISPTKLSLLVNSIVNMKASSAINQLQFSPKRISRVILKVLNAAIANAENNHNADIDKLRIKSLIVNQGMRLKRIKPRARGRADRITKPTCHIEIILTDEAI